MKNKVFLVLLLAVILSNCSDKKSNFIDTDTLTIEAKSIEKIYGCPDTRYSLNVDLKYPFD